MKVRISYVVDVDAGTRRAILHYYGWPDSGLYPRRRYATRKDIQEWFERFGHSMDDDLSHEHGACCMGVAPKEEEEPR
jgi:hypothetical protein